MKEIEHAVGADRPPGRRFRRPLVLSAGGFAVVLALGVALGGGLVRTPLTLATQAASQTRALKPPGLRGMATGLAKEGRNVFRHSTFGDQGFWGGTLQINRAIEGRKLGGVGPGVSPKTALAVGLKVDVTRLPKAVKQGIKNGSVNLNSPKTTLALLKLNSVVGVKGFFNRKGSLRSVGITCAVCHSTVNNSFAPGIGHRLDGWANRDLNVGAVINLAPPGRLQPVAQMLGVNEATVRQVLTSWGPGKFDAELFLDGKAFQPNGKSAATLIPPAFGLAGVNLHTWTGWGSVTQWNAFVANLEMHGIGTYHDTRLDNAKQFPIAAKAGLGHIDHAKDLITPKLPALAAYEELLASPKPPKGSFNAAMAKRGKRLFMTKAGCATCHVPPLFTEPGWNLHPGSDLGISNFQANRSPTHMYRTAPLHGLWTHTKGGFYHDGRFKSLLAVVNHYNSFQNLKLTLREKKDLVQYLKSL